MLKKRKFWVHNVLATAFIFGFMWVAGQFFAIFDFLDPIGDALEGYEITDQVFSNPQWREIPPIDENILIVNLGDPSRGADRRVTAEQLNIINSFGPKVIGLDAIFRSLKQDTLGDFILAHALANSPNIVMYEKLLDPNEENIWTDAEYSHPLFAQDHPTGSVNLISQDPGSGQYDFKECRTFFPEELYLNPETGEIDTVYAFAVELARRFNPEITEEFMERDNEEEIINFRGNILDFGLTKHGNRYFTLDWDQVLDTTTFTADLVKDKIVLMGFLGSYLGDRNTVEDKYFTPLNEKYVGRALPDMYGVVIHANIISMILNRDYLDQMKDSTAWILAVIVCFLNVVLFSWIYYTLPKWYDGVTKLIQLIEALLFTFIIILVFHFFNFKLNLTWVIVAVLFAGDSLEVYYGVIVNAYEKIARKLFTNKKVVV